MTFARVLSVVAMASLASVACSKSNKVKTPAETPALQDQKKPEAPLVVDEPTQTTPENVISQPEVPVEPKSEVSANPPAVTINEAQNGQKQEPVEGKVEQKQVQVEGKVEQKQTRQGDQDPAKPAEQIQAQVATETEDTQTQNSQGVQR